ncbi:hemolysin family protein [Dactylosporangium sp. AC04546]|uniref:hemolysin family protein n=1 Tax=Dactylosporangium sp. AC04546 TaxID=2862460 RepID=UPI001EE09BE7|nr:hemolysin family protein [Dactylosporangium sp. AC04546]WVK86905.1 hemolysin family protein [Dactylosporangium sp. AC04546]
MSLTTALAASLVLLALNAFFVAAEFALIASKRHRLEALAADGSPAARAALAGNRELSLMLAGSQLGITLCSLGLGALAKPALADLLEPLLHATGLPSQASYVAAFIMALAVVVFLHMVVGEMAPKSWAITHPERSALLLALPFRAFARLARPALAVLNAMANATLRLFRITPQDELAQAHGPDELRMLLQTSREHGTLPASDEQLLTAILSLQRTTVAAVMIPAEQMVTVRAGAAAREVEQQCLRYGRSRLPVTDDGRIVGIVHARDALKATTDQVGATAGHLMTAPFTLSAQHSALEAIRAMREHRAQVAIVTDHDDPVGLVALEDLLEQVIGQFDDETDPIVAAYRNAPARTTESRTQKGNR